MGSTHLWGCISILISPVFNFFEAKEAVEVIEANEAIVSDEVNEATAVH